MENVFLQGQLSAREPSKLIAQKDRPNGIGPQLIAEIGDVTRFEHRGALTAFAGVDPRKKESGDQERKSNPTTKKGSPHLRKTLFQIMDGLILRSPMDNPVYAFMDKKRAEGKPYFVYMTAGANKFLRIYYGKVNAFLAAKEEAEAEQTDAST